MLKMPTLGRRREAAQNGARGGNGYGSAPVSSIDTIDPRNINSELTPGDIEQKPLTPRPSDADIVALVMGRFKDGRSGRTLLERNWILNVAYEANHQYIRWDERRGLQSTKDDKDIYRVYEQHNFIAPLTQKNTARAAQSKPDASTRPESDSQTDLLASEETTDILSHTDAQFDRQEQNLELIRIAQIMSAPCLKIAWNPTKEAAIPTGFDPQGNNAITGMNMAPVGDLEEEVVNPLFIVTDPKANRLENSLWLIDARMKSLTEVQDKYGDKDTNPTFWKNAARVKGGMSDDTGFASTLTSFLAAANGDFLSQASDAVRKHEVLLLEMWEKPSPRYKNGRLIVVADGQVLRYEDWPYDRKDAFPYVRLPYKESIGSIYSANNVSGVRPMQDQYNRVLSYISNRANIDFPALLVPKGAEIGVDAYSSPRNLKIIYHSHGMPPTYQAPPPVSEYVFKLLEIIESNIRLYMGVHEVSDGSVPGGVSAASAIELLQQSDTTQLAEFTAHIEQFQANRAEWEIELYRQFVKEPRLIGISSDGDPKAAAAKAHTFKGLRAGGQVRVVVTPGSATPKSPVARQQQIQEWLNDGLLGPPGVPATTEIYFKLLGEARSDSMVEAAIKGHGQAVQIAQAHAHADAQAQAQHAAQAQGPPPPPDPMMLAKLKLDADMQMLQAKSQADTAAKIALMRAERELDKEFGPKIAPITVKADPAFTTAVEEATPYDVHSAAAHLGSVVAGSPALAPIHGVPTPAPPQPDPMELESHRAQLGQQTAEHGAGLEMQKMQATQAMTPPPPEAEPAPEPPDPNEELAREKELASHVSALKVKEIEAAAKARPTPPAK